MGHDVAVFKNEQAPEPNKSFFKYDKENFTLDFLPRLKASLKFRPAYERRELVTFKDVDISFISYDDLIVDKMTDARPKDITDIEQLGLKRRNKKL